MTGGEPRQEASRFLFHTGGENGATASVRLFSAPAAPFGWVARRGVPTKARRPSRCEDLSVSEPDQLDALSKGCHVRELHRHKRRGPTDGGVRWTIRPVSTADLLIRHHGKARRIACLLLLRSDAPHPGVTAVRDIDARVTGDNTRGIRNLGGKLLVSAAPTQMSGFASECLWKQIWRRRDRSACFGAATQLVDRRSRSERSRHRHRRRSGYGVGRCHAPNDIRVSDDEHAEAQRGRRTRWG